MEIAAEKILENRNFIFDTIEKYISSPRKEQLLEFYNEYDERLTMLPASPKKLWHNSFEGGYFDHVRRVIEGALKMHSIWGEMGVDTSTYTLEELMFSAINHDLGKMGNEEHVSYIPNDDKWRMEKLGENYKYNIKIPFSGVPDRSLYLLQAFGIKCTFNETLAIRLHDGLWDEANKKYLITYLPEQKPRTALPFILHQADLMASRIEFEIEWAFEHSSESKTKKPFKLKNNIPTKQKVLSSLKNKNLVNMIENL